MGLIRGSFSLSNPTRPDLAPLEVTALVNSGAMHLCIPEHLAIQLSLGELERREVVLADGHRRTVPYVGPVEVRFRNRRCFTGAMVLGNEVLLGAIPMEDMDLVLRPQLQSVDVNPESPNIAVSVAKVTTNTRSEMPSSSCHPLQLPLPAGSLGVTARQIKAAHRIWPPVPPMA